RVVADGVSGTEALPVGLQDKHLDVIVAVRVPQRVVDLFDLLLILGVRLLGPVERDFRYSALLFVDYPFVGLADVHSLSYDVMTPISTPMSYTVPTSPVHWTVPDAPASISCSTFSVAIT